MLQYMYNTVYRIYPPIRSLLIHVLIYRNVNVSVLVRAAAECVVASAFAVDTDSERVEAERSAVGSWRGARCRSGASAQCARRAAADAGRRHATPGRDGLREPLAKQASAGRARRRPGDGRARAAGAGRQQLARHSPLTLTNCTVHITDFLFQRTLPN